MRAASCTRCGAAAWPCRASPGPVLLRSRACGDAIRDVRRGKRDCAPAATRPPGRMSEVSPRPRTRPPVPEAQQKPNALRHLGRSIRLILGIRALDHCAHRFPLLVAHILERGIEVAAMRLELDSLKVVEGSTGELHDAYAEWVKAQTGFAHMSFIGRGSQYDALITEGVQDFREDLDPLAIRNSREIPAKFR